MSSQLSDRRRYLVVHDLYQCLRASIQLGLEHVCVRMGESGDWLDSRHEVRVSEFCL